VNLYAYVLADPINFLDPLGQGGTAADPLVQNTAGFKDAKAGIDAYNTAKSAGKLYDTITEKGVKATAQGHVEDMGNDAMQKIAPSPINQYKDGVNEMAATAEKSGNLYNKAVDSTFGKANESLQGRPCQTAQTAPPAKVDPPKPGLWERIFGPPSKPDVAAQRDGPIPRKPLFSASERAAAAR
jgi:hypothetical protein